MPYSTQASGTTITAAWSNANVRDQVVTPFASAAARDSAITVPVVGMVEYLSTNLSTEGLTTRTSAGTWRLPWNMPWGWVASASTIVNQTGIDSTQVDLTNLTVTFTAVAGRRLRVTGYVPWQGQTGTGIVSYCLITDGANTGLTFSQKDIRNTTDTGVHQPMTLQTPAAGSVTYKLRGSTSVATNQWQTVVNTGAAALIVVEDIGPNGAPS